MKRLNCIDCGIDMDYVPNRKRCGDCNYENQRAIRERSPLAARAAQVVSTAVKTGYLPKLDGTIKCVDCRGIADRYDHRDYLKPLDVEPVCCSCNGLRGTAINHNPEDKENLLPEFYSAFKVLLKMNGSKS